MKSDLHPDSDLGIDVRANRRARRYTRVELVGRVLWSMSHPLFRFSPRVLWGWRNLMLRAFGARIGRHVRIHPSAEIAIPWNVSIGDLVGIGDRAILYSLGRITIGNGATISQGAHLCAGTHDHRHPTLPLLKPPITIEPAVWVCADAFVGPGVTVGRRAIVGARAVVMRDVQSNAIVAGNPARIVSRRAQA
ncbi:MAG: hypothetical protein E5Y55_25775 [Mesorhizobium sp.]|nr:MAG: hypothetical protein EOS00_13025 [Mesorhizobium sp.]RWO31123.1 MAG: hypothetical protein EOS10_15525 [Mesorhizobium sp.]TIM40995.1 MAG: hypothetical protein E5Y55_25775 [Mesorhizobium sp.]